MSIISLYLTITMLISIGMILKQYNKNAKYHVQEVLAWLVIILISPIFVPLVIGATLEKLNDK